MGDSRRVANIHGCLHDIYITVTNTKRSAGGAGGQVIKTLKQMYPSVRPSVRARVKAAPCGRISISMKDYCKHTCFSPDSSSEAKYGGTQAAFRGNYGIQTCLTHV